MFEKLKKLFHIDYDEKFYRDALEGSDFKIKKVFKAPNKVLIVGTTEGYDGLVFSISHKAKQQMIGLNIQDLQELVDLIVAWSEE